MRRIDLFCKLIAPVFISLIDSISTQIAIWVVLGLNVISVFIEYVAIAQVYRSVPALKKRTAPDLNETNGENESLLNESTQGAISHLRESLAPWKEYIASRVFLPSFALSLLYLTVLSFGATMVTYLLHSGFNALEVSCMRIGSVVAEVSGTWTAPLIMSRIGPIRSGLWFLNWQFCCIAGAALTFVLSGLSSQLVAGSLIVGVALSRVGLWGFDLSAQFLIQEVSTLRFLSMLFVDLWDMLICVIRMWKSTSEQGSLQQRWRCKTSLKCFHLHQPLYGLPPSNSSIQ